MRLHRFLSSHLVYAALLATSVAAGLLALRLGWSERSTYTFLAWNLVLAWVPFAISLGVALLARLGARVTLAPALTAWFVFFPNAPYVVTDFVHLKARAPVPLWFDVALMFSFAGAGLLLGVASLAHVQQTLAAIGRAGLGWLVVLATVPATGLGIWIGRWHRWNSWDLATRPDAVLRDVVAPFLDPHAHVQALAIIAVHAVLFGAAYLALRPTLAPAAIPERASR